MEMELPISSRVIFLLLLTGFYIFFLLGGIAISRSRSKRLRELAGEADSSSPTSQKMVKLARLIIGRAEYFLLGTQIGTFFISVGIGYEIVALAQSEAFWGAVGSPLHALQGSWLAMSIVKTVMLVVVSFSVLLAVQLLKALAYSNPEKTLCILAPSLIVSAKVLSPFIFLLRRVGGGILSLFGSELPLERELAISAEEINEIVELSSEAGEIEQDEREMIAGVFSFADTIVREVMTPRKDVVSVEDTATWEEILQTFKKEGLSRLLVTGSNLDEVKGIILAKDLLLFLHEPQTAFDLKRLLRKPYFVSSNKKIGTLLREMRKEVRHFAVVLDEHGGVDGIVTVEDLVEEIVGEIFDEFDSPLEEKEARLSKSGDLLVDGSMATHDLNETYGYEIPEGEYDTVAGFVIHLMGRIPEPGEVIEYEGIKIKVEAVSQNRLTLLRFIKSNKISGLSPVETKPAEPQAIPSAELPEENPQREVRISGSR